MSNRDLFDEAFVGVKAPTSTSAAGRERRRTLRNVLIALGALPVLIGIAVAAGFAMLNAKYNEIDRIDVIDLSLERPMPVVVPSGSQAPINILLLGADARNPDDDDVPTEALRGFRSDAIMVAQVSPNREHITVMSIMRDNWVPIQGVGEAKINAAVAYGGVPLAVNTVEHFIDARIDHVMLIDFESFVGLTDALGGVTVDNPIEFTSTHGGYKFAKGHVTMNGAEALGFVRERYAFADGDYQRVRNQQRYLKAVVSTLLSSDTPTSPAKVTGAFDALAPYLIVDSGLDLNAAVGLGVKLSDFKSGNIGFFTSPTMGTGVSGDGQSIVLPDWTELKNMQSAMRGGTLDHYAATRAPGSEFGLGW